MASAIGMLTRLKLYWELARPLTLLPPTLGVVSGAVSSLGARVGVTNITWRMAVTISLGAVCAATLNAASNIINQVYDEDIDRENKPHRPLPSGRISRGETLRLSLFLYAGAIVPTYWIVPAGRRECMIIFLLGALGTLIYSVPAFGRTKRHGLLANVTIAVPRGCLLKVAGWSMVSTVFDPEPWYIGTVFMLFLLGAASTKDFADAEGDARYGIRTLPIILGPNRAAWLISPSFLIPWLLIPIGCLVGSPMNSERGLLSGNTSIFGLLTCLLVLWGGYVVWLILRNPGELAKTENHPSWHHMYWMMMSAQLGFGLAYCF